MLRDDNGCMLLQKPAIKFHNVLLHAEMAMMKSYALNQPDGKGGANRFVAYMVPKDPPKEQPAHPSSRSALPCLAAMASDLCVKDL